MGMREELAAALVNPNMKAQFDKARANVIPPNNVMDSRYTPWKRNQQQADAFLNLADILTTAAPLAAPVAAGTKALAKALAPTAGRMMEDLYLASGLNPGIVAYHGSPHRFDKFDISKIGTGEGAQAYGHGLYFAEHPDVAKAYQPRASWQVVNKQDDSAEQFLAMVLDPKQKPIGKKSFPNSQEAEKYARDLAYKYENGAFYKVDIPDEAVARMLDWDKPLSQQPHLADSLRRFADEYGLVEPMPNMTGRDYYQALENYTGATSAEGVKRNVSQDVSGLLKQYGIPGIRYLDQGSRAGGAGTSNFVLFDDQLPKILGRE